MTYLSLLGVIVGISLFILFAFKGVNIIISGIAATLVMIFTSGMDILPLVNDVWAGSFADFMRSWFLVFIFSAIYGKLLSDSGAARQVAMVISRVLKKISKKNERMLAVLTCTILYMLMSVVGMSGWVIIFTVIDIGRNLLKEVNVPWRLYCYGGSGGFAAVFIPGSLLLGNVQAMGAAGVGVAASPVLGFAALAVFFVVLILFINADLRKADRMGEGFIETGMAYEQAYPGRIDENEKLPSALLSFIPLLVVIVTAAFLGWPVLVAICAGVVSCVICLWKYLNNTLKSITDGMVSGFGPVIMIAATTAMAAVLRAVPGFGMITSVLNLLPSLYGGVLLGVITTLFISTPASTIAAFGSDILEKFAAAGLSNADCSD